jgi:hypothetical protein
MRGVGLLRVLYLVVLCWCAGANISIPVCGLCALCAEAPAHQHRTTRYSTLSKPTPRIAFLL